MLTPTERGFGPPGGAFCTWSQLVSFSGLLETCGVLRGCLVWRQTPGHPPTLQHTAPGNSFLFSFSFLAFLLVFWGNLIFFLARVTAHGECRVSSVRGWAEFLSRCRLANIPCSRCTMAIVRMNTGNQEQSWNVTDPKTAITVFGPSTKGMYVDFLRASP
ncbi:hypothetical protein LZ32DRAFT_363279 [Colletotrichum eremochloae]|nr:hypothetical protein LZ32DRAFT_363279 [Colletotrichum eremochloae]